MLIFLGGGGPLIPLSHGKKGGKGKKRKKSPGDRQETWASSPSITPEELGRKDEKGKRTFYNIEHIESEDGGKKGEKGKKKKKGGGKGRGKGPGDGQRQTFPSAIALAQGTIIKGKGKKGGVKMICQLDLSKRVLLSGASSLKTKEEKGRRGGGT